MKKNSDILARFMFRQIESLDHVINEILGQLDFKSIVTSQGPRIEQPEMSEESLRFEIVKYLFETFRRRVPTLPLL